MLMSDENALNVSLGDLLNSPDQQINLSQLKTVVTELR